MRRLAVAAILTAGVTACVPPPPPVGCHEAVDNVWPEGSRAWAHRIVERESRGRPTAQNRRSSAAGCFQLLRLHSGRFSRVGYTWGDRYDATANALAALDLYTEQGRRPWR